MKTKLHVFLVAVSLFGIFFSTAGDTLIGFLVNILAASSVLVIEWFIGSKYVRLLFGTLFRRAKIRISISYLVSIRMDDKYLLIEGNRIPGQFQPIGGVYKATEEGMVQLRKWGVHPDPNMPGEQNDLRIVAPPSRVLDVVEWFEHGRGREAAPFREFYEELIADDLIPRSGQPAFRTPLFEFQRRRIPWIGYSSHFKMRELLLSDIYELKLTGEQTSVLRRILDSDKVKWFSADEIERECRVIAGVSVSRISNNAIWLLEGD